MKEQVTKQKVTVLIPAEVVAHLKQGALNKQRSFNRELVWALQQYLGQHADGKK